MRKLMVVFAFLISCGLLFTQNAPQLACDGRRATVRISEITTNRMVKDFIDAVTARERGSFRVA
jgi:hypothetical protein